MGRALQRRAKPMTWLVTCMVLSYLLIEALVVVGPVSTLALEEAKTTKEAHAEVGNSMLEVLSEDIAELGKGEGEINYSNENVQVDEDGEQVHESLEESKTVVTSRGEGNERSAVDEAGRAEEGQGEQGDNYDQGKDTVADIDLGILQAGREDESISIKTAELPVRESAQKSGEDVEAIMTNGEDEALGKSLGHVESVPEGMEEYDAVGGEALERPYASDVPAQTSEDQISPESLLMSDPGLSMGVDGSAECTGPCEEEATDSLQPNLQHEAHAFQDADGRKDTAGMDAGVDSPPLQGLAVSTEQANGPESADGELGSGGEQQGSTWAEGGWKQPMLRKRRWGNTGGSGAGAILGGIGGEDGIFFRGRNEEIAQIMRDVEAERGQWRVSGGEEKTLLDIWADKTRDFVLTRIVPPTDAQCSFNWNHFRCEPKCSCRVRFEPGDYSPDRSCRLMHEGEGEPGCREGVWDPTDDPVLRRLGQALVGLWGDVREVYERRIAPPTDGECGFSFKRWRCEPAPQCELRLKFGDLTVSSACRLTPDWNGDGGDDWEGEMEGLWEGSEEEW